MPFALSLRSNGVKEGSIIPISTRIVMVISAYQCCCRLYLGLGAKVRIADHFLRLWLVQADSGCGVSDGCGGEKVLTGASYIERRLTCIAKAGWGFC